MPPDHRSDNRRQSNRNPNVTFIGDVMRLPSHMVDSTAPEQPMLRPQTGNGHGLNAVFAESARLNAIHRAQERDTGSNTVVPFAGGLTPAIVARALQTSPRSDGSNGQLDDAMSGEIDRLEHRDRGEYQRSAPFNIYGTPLRPIGPSHLLTEPGPTRPIPLPVPTERLKKVTKQVGHEPAPMRAWPAGDKACGWKVFYKTKLVIRAVLVGKIPIPMPKGQGKKAAFIRDLRDAIVEWIREEAIEDLPTMYTWNRVRDLLQSQLEGWLAKKQDPDILGPLDCEEPCYPIASIDYFELLSKYTVDNEDDIVIAEDGNGFITYTVNVSILYEVGFTIECAYGESF